MYTQRKDIRLDVAIARFCDCVLLLIHSGDYRYRIYLSDSSNNECQWNIAMIDTATLQ